MGRSTRRRGPARAGPAARAVRHNLPTQLTTFIGRTQEVAEIRQLLGSTRLVTLTGPGGCGKTRLALEVAAGLLEHYPDGIWLVELAPLADPTLVPNRVAAVLDIPEQVNRPLTETVASHVRTKHMLVLLDNCEHVRSACQDIIEDVLRTSPNVRIVVTSREALRIGPEQTYHVPSLSLPDDRDIGPSAQLAQHDAIRLFTERAGYARAGFALTDENAHAIVQICRQLDGMPLAIELAAVHVVSLSVEQIVARLAEVLEVAADGGRRALSRHRTLRAALEWSYHLLTAPERMLFRRLSVFAGGWILEAAEAVCAGDGLGAEDVYPLLRGLIMKSLVVREEHAGAARYKLLGTIRQYAHEKLGEEPHGARSHRAHRDWYLGLAEEADPELRRPRAEFWLDRLEREHDNLRAALDWSEGQKDGAEAALRIVGHLHTFWIFRDHWKEGARRAAQALKRSDEAAPALLPRALAAMTNLAWRGGDDALAIEAGERGLAVCRALGDEDSHARGLLLFQLGQVAMRREDYARAEALFHDSVAVATRANDHWLHGVVLVHLGSIAGSRGDVAGAGACHTQSVGLLRKVGAKWAIALARHRLGWHLAHDRRQFPQAIAEFVESLILVRQARSRWIVAESLEGFAQVASATGNFEDAARLFGAAGKQREAVGLRHTTREQTTHDESVAAVHLALGDADFKSLLRDGELMELDTAIEFARGLEQPLIASVRGRRTGPVSQSGAPLTARELDVAMHIETGRSNRDIASHLWLSERTVDVHVQHIMTKLHVHTRAQIAAWVVKRGLLPPSDGTG